MATRIPLVVGSNGLPQQLQSSDQLAAGMALSDTRVWTNGESSVAMVLGMPAYLSAAGTVKRAEANTASTSLVVGLTYDSSISASASGNYVNGGILTGTTTQWDAVVTGESGGLTFGSLYFVDPANVGKLTTTVPTTVGQLVVMVGVGVSSTDMEIRIGSPIQL